MPFDTVQHSSKRLRQHGPWDLPDDLAFSSPAYAFDDATAGHGTVSFVDYWRTRHAALNTMTALWKYDHNVTIQPQRKQSLPLAVSTASNGSSGRSHGLRSPSTMLASPLEADDTSSTVSTLSTSTSTTSLCPSNLQQWLNRSCSLITTPQGLTLEARIANATEFRSLVDAFQSLCQVDETTATQVPAPHHHASNSTTSVALCRNKLHKSKPVNFFLSLCDLGRIALSSSTIYNQLALKHIVDACIKTFFTCWVRYSTIIHKQSFMQWYMSTPHAMDTPIVNAMCATSFAHMINHHMQPGLEHFRANQDLILEQQQLFFDRARDSLASSLDTPSDRYTIVALVLMSCMAEPDRRTHYSGLATSALLELDIYPLMEADDDTDDITYAQELDNRLWWYVWAVDFYLYSTGVPRNAPKMRRDGVPAFPQVHEEDIDEAEHSVLTDIYCLRLWKFQEDVLDAFYAKDDQVTTAQQLRQYDNQLLTMYQDMPAYLQLDSGFVYGCPDLFLACVRVNIEFNATRLILHMPFLPDASDAQPNQLALQSLHVCLKTALLQLRTIQTTCRTDAIFRCAFDRDEFWRACEILSLALDVYRSCDTTHRHLILDGLAPADLTASLHKAKSILQSSVEFTIGSKNWLHVNDWLNKEIARHERLDHASPVSPAMYMLQNDSFHPVFKQDASNVSSPPPPPLQPILHDDHIPPPTFIVPSQKSPSPAPRPPPHATSMPPPPPPATTAPMAVNASFQVSSRSSPPSQMATQLTTGAPPVNMATEFIAFCPEDEFDVSSPKQKSRRASTKQQQPRFRYFNPRTLNKYLFIDDHPLL
ncbi:hypothetical protein BC940DRAFT_54388 [Gongronella butleri]|nr:hypothetical protein BC940DRAFT_54388 [Gongronella butleri]